MDGYGWLITDPETGLVDGYYLNMDMALDAYASWSLRLERPMALSCLERSKMVTIPDACMLNEEVCFE